MRLFSHDPVVVTSKADFSLVSRFCTITLMLMHYSTQASTRSSAERAGERRKIGLRAIRISRRKVGDCFIEARAGAGVSGDESGIARTRMRERERSPAERGVLEEFSRAETFEVRVGLSVAKPPDVVVLAAFELQPAQEHVARRLHEALARYHARPVIGILARARVRLEDRRGGLLELQNQHVVRPGLK